jgi:hypothetical protein
VILICSDEDEGTCVNLDDLKNSLEECFCNSSDSETEESRREDQPLTKPSAKLLKDDDSRVMAFIPASFAKELEFAELKILSEEKYKPNLRILDKLCCPIVCLSPHGMLFSGENRVYLSVPVLVHDENLIACLCSDTGLNEVRQVNFLMTSGEQPYFKYFRSLNGSVFPKQAIAIAVGVSSWRCPTSVYLL